MKKLRSSRVSSQDKASANLIGSKLKGGSSLWSSLLSSKRAIPSQPGFLEFQLYQQHLQNRTGQSEGVLFLLPFLLT